MPPDDPVIRAAVAVIEASRFLRRVHVRPYAAFGRGLVVELAQGGLVEWQTFWKALEAAEAVFPTPKKNAARVAPIKPPPVTLRPKPKTTRVPVKD